MSLRLRLLVLFMRLVEKPILTRIPGPFEARERFDIQAARIVRPPRGCHIHPQRIIVDALDARRELNAEWISHDHPDRRKVVLFMHGGAFFMGSPQTHRRITGSLALHSGARVLAVDYRLAPEHPFPAALEDGVAAYRHLLAAGYDPSNIAFAGDSAGGNLVFAMLLKLQRLDLPSPAAILALCPWADLTLGSDSLRRNANREPMLPVARMREAVAAYLAEHPSEDPLASPVFGDFSTPPPTLIQASRIELVADDAEVMAERLRDAGGDVRIEYWRNTPHVWHFFAGLLPEADDAMKRAGEFIAEQLEVEID